MPRVDYVTCKSCGRHADDVGPISWERYCSQCGQEQRDANLDQLVAKSGPYFDRWRASMAACVGAVIPTRSSDLAPSSSRARTP